MNTKLVVAFDLDDVLVQCNRAFADWHNENYGTKCTYRGFTTFHLDKFLGCTQAEVLNRFMTFYESGHHSRMLPTRGAVSGIRLLRKMGYEIHIITARPEKRRGVTVALLESLFSGQYEALHLANHFEGERPRKKSEICREISAPLIVEDAIHNATDCGDNGITVLMPKRPWNKKFFHSRVTVVTSWAEIVGHIQLS